MPDWSPLQQQLQAALQASGVQPGDLILVHSDASPLMPLLKADWWEDALAFLQSGFEAVLGPQGTLVVPTFNYEFCRGRPYDHERTPSQVGLFTNYVRADSRAVRS